MRILVTWFNLGRMPKAPGTWGTLGAVPLAWLLMQGGPVFYLMATVILTAVAMILCHLYETQNPGHDRPEVVLDEVVGYLISLAWLPVSWQAFVAAFVLFRLLDILKPPPIGWLDQKVPGGVGVVADDVAAGILTNILLQLVFVYTPWLGYQLPS